MPQQKYVKKTTVSHTQASPSPSSRLVPSTPRERRPPHNDGPPSDAGAFGEQRRGDDGRRLAMEAGMPATNEEMARYVQSRVRSHVEEFVRTNGKRVVDLSSEVVRTLPPGTHDISQIMNDVLPGILIEGLPKFIMIGFTTAMQLTTKDFCLDSRVQQLTNAFSNLGFNLAISLAHANITTAWIKDTSEALAARHQLPMGVSAQRLEDAIRTAVADNIPAVMDTCSSIMASVVSAPEWTNAHLHRSLFARHHHDPQLAATRNGTLGRGVRRREERLINTVVNGHFCDPFGVGFTNYKRITELGGAIRPPMQLSVQDSRMKGLIYFNRTVTDAAVQRPSAPLASPRTTKWQGWHKRAAPDTAPDQHGGREADTNPLPAACVEAALRETRETTTAGGRHSRPPFHRPYPCPPWQRRDQQQYERRGLLPTLDTSLFETRASRWSTAVPPSTGPLLPPPAPSSSHKWSPSTRLYSGSAKSGIHTFQPRDEESPSSSGTFLPSGRSASFPSSDQPVAAAEEDKTGIPVPRGEVRGGEEDSRGGRDGETDQLMKTLENVYESVVAPPPSDRPCSPISSDAVPPPPPVAPPLSSAPTRDLPPLHLSQYAAAEHQYGEASEDETPMPANAVPSIGFAPVVQQTSPLPSPSGGAEPTPCAGLRDGVKVTDAPAGTDKGDEGAGVDAGKGRGERRDGSDDSSVAGAPSVDAARSDSTVLKHQLNPFAKDFVPGGATAALAMTQQQQQQQQPQQPQQPQQQPQQPAPTLPAIPVISGPVSPAYKMGMAASYKGTTPAELAKRADAMVKEAIHKDREERKLLLMAQSIKPPFTSLRSALSQEGRREIDRRPLVRPFQQPSDETAEWPSGAGEASGSFLHRLMGEAPRFDKMPEALRVICEVEREGMPPSPRPEYDWAQLKAAGGVRRLAGAGMPWRPTSAATAAPPAPPLMNPPLPSSGAAGAEMRVSSAPIPAAMPSEGRGPLPIVANGSQGGEVNVNEDRVVTVIVPQPLLPSPVAAPASVGVPIAAIGVPPAMPPPSVMTSSHEGPESRRPDSAFGSLDSPESPVVGPPDVFGGPVVANGAGAAAMEMPERPPVFASAHPHAHSIPPPPREPPTYIGQPGEDDHAHMRPRLPMTSVGAPPPLFAHRPAIPPASRPSIPPLMIDTAWSPTAFPRGGGMPRYGPGSRDMSAGLLQAPPKRAEVIMSMIPSQPPPAIDAGRMVMMEQQFNHSQQQQHHHHHNHHQQHQHGGGRPAGAATARHTDRGPPPYPTVSSQTSSAHRQVRQTDTRPPVTREPAEESQASGPSRQRAVGRGLGISPPPASIPPSRPPMRHGSAGTPSQSPYNDSYGPESSPSPSPLAQSAPSGALSTHRAQARQEVGSGSRRTPGQQYGPDLGAERGREGERDEPVTPNTDRDATGWPGDLGQEWSPYQPPHQHQQQPPQHHYYQPTHGPPPPYRGSRGGRPPQRSYRRRVQEGGDDSPRQADWEEPSSSGYGHVKRRTGRGGGEASSADRPDMANGSHNHATGAAVANGPHNHATGAAVDESSEYSAGGLSRKSTTDPPSLPAPDPSLTNHRGGSMSISYGRGGVPPPPPPMRGGKLPPKNPTLADFMRVDRRGNRHRKEMRRKHREEGRGGGGDDFMTDVTNGNGGEEVCYGSPVDGSVDVKGQAIAEAEDT
ncbi:unnamed protein product [Vitrella brassicaformis CCMP3155]|uniref:CCR4-NOT transcription complex subunit 1 domain-containing protein n=1 Tax=Vitrella brassicaformis (strain CCMP3155) TaxID=1169540 RepID=A0A0G4GM68_VITBC|nr:unnamed protein product [Vitrella brassicaformis CCMP3155]|eukprot:CEM31296.1 unnamed protein product [Vitrella brassicaformis CCMP3155]